MGFRTALTNTKLGSLGLLRSSQKRTITILSGLCACVRVCVCVGVDVWRVLGSLGKT